MQFVPLHADVGEFIREVRMYIGVLVTTINPVERVTEAVAIWIEVCVLPQALGSFRVFYWWILES